MRKGKREEVFFIFYLIKGIIMSDYSLISDSRLPTPDSQLPLPTVTRHYFDWAATAIPRRPASFSGECACFGNPSSRHSEGRAAKEALENARERCAAVLGVEPETLYFTSGGTEANCIALYSNLFRPSGRIIASRAEHPSITENAEMLRRLGKLTGTLPVDSMGRVSPELLEETLEKYGDVRYAAVMAVNNETGTIIDISTLRRCLESRDGPPVHLHCDAVQALGKIKLDLKTCDSASMSAHKIGGPRGIGLLYLQKALEPLYSGGGQEGKIRPGTENVQGALAFAACLEEYAAAQTLAANYEQAHRRMIRLISALSGLERCAVIPRSRAECDASFSPYILQLGFRGIPGEVLVRYLDDLGFALSTGSACSSAALNRPVLAAMGIDDETSRTGVRVSQGWSTGDDEIELLISAIKGALAYL